MASQVKGAIEEAFEIFELSYSPAKNSDLDLDYTLVTGSFKTSLCIEF
jgi:hypothetical protein